MWALGICITKEPTSAKWWLTFWVFLWNLEVVHLLKSLHSSSNCILTREHLSRVSESLISFVDQVSKFRISFFLYSWASLVLFLWGNSCATLPPSSVHPFLLHPPMQCCFGNVGTVIFPGCWAWIPQQQPLILSSLIECESLQKDTRTLGLERWPSS